MGACPENVILQNINLSLRNIKNRQTMYSSWFRGDIQGENKCKKENSCPSHGYGIKLRYAQFWAISCRGKIKNAIQSRRKS